MTVKRQPCHLALQWGDKWLGKDDTRSHVQRISTKKKKEPPSISLSLSLLTFSKFIVNYLFLSDWKNKNNKFSCVGFRLSFLTFFGGGEMRHVGQTNRSECVKRRSSSVRDCVSYFQTVTRKKNVRKVLAERRRSLFTFFLVFSVCRRLRIFVAQDVEVEWFQGRYGRITRICCNTKKTQ